MITTCLDLSTAHLRPETMASIQNGKLADKAATINLGITIATYETGAFITVPPDLPKHEQVPGDLWCLLRDARELGASLIRLDSDGPEVDLLRRYAWP